MDADIVQAIILGIVQGIAEFLPISSSGHLTIFQAILQEGRESASGLVDENLYMNVALHLGTLISIVIVYRYQIRNLLSSWKLCLAIVLATIPVGIIGMAFKDTLELIFTTPLFAGVFLILTAILLLLGQRLEEQSVGIKAPVTDMTETPMSEVTLWQALGVGFFQALAILPGVSRSGSTIAGGLMLKMERPQAATFSFLIAIPAIGGAAVLTMKDILELNNTSHLNFLPLLIGLITAAVVGWLSLRFLLRIIAKGKLHWFAIYCWLVGIVTIAWRKGWHPEDWKKFVELMS